MEEILHSKTNIFVFFLFCIFCGCSFPDDTYQNFKNYSVIAILSNEQNKQKVYCYKVNDIETNTTALENFVHNANVSINGKSMIEIYQDKFPQEKFYKIDSVGFIQPNTNYNVLIETDGKIIDGNTHTPTLVEFITPKIVNIQLQNSSDTLLIEWSDTIERQYIFSLTYPLKEFLPGYFDRRIEEEIINKKTKSIVVRDTGQYIAKVISFDENYKKYFIDKELVAGINNAYGVFASISVDSILINVTKP